MVWPGRLGKAWTTIAADEDYRREMEGLYRHRQSHEEKWKSFMLRQPAAPQDVCWKVANLPPDAVATKLPRWSPQSSIVIDSGFQLNMQLRRGDLLSLDSASGESEITILEDRALRHPYIDILGFCAFKLKNTTEEHLLPQVMGNRRVATAEHESNNHESLYNLRFQTHSTPTCPAWFGTMGYTRHKSSVDSCGIQKTHVWLMYNHLSMNAEQKACAVDLLLNLTGFYSWFLMGEVRHPSSHAPEAPINTLPLAVPELAACGASNFATPEAMAEVCSTRSYGRDYGRKWAAESAVTEDAAQPAPPRPVQSSTIPQPAPRPMMLSFDIPPMPPGSTSFVFTPGTFADHSATNPGRVNIQPAVPTSSVPPNLPPTVAVMPSSEEVNPEPVELEEVSPTHSRKWASVDTHSTSNIDRRQPAAPDGSSYSTPWQSGRLWQPPPLPLPSYQTPLPSPSLQLDFVSDQLQPSFMRLAEQPQDDDVPPLTSFCTMIGAASGASDDVRGAAHAGTSDEGDAQFLPLLERDVSRPLLEQFMEEALSASFPTGLPSGRDIEKEMLAAIAALPNAPDPFMQVLRTFFIDHKQFAATLWLDVDTQWTAHGEHNGLPPGFRMQEEDITRPNTSSWHRDESEHLMIDQVKGLIHSQHTAEARTWSLAAEVWKPLPSTWNLTDIQLGGSNYATKTPRLKAARGAFVDDKWVDDMSFSLNYTAIGCTPDFDNAISTLAVRDKTDPAVVCLRSVSCITLAEVFHRFSDHLEYRNILNAWMEGKVVCSAKHSRGSSGGSKGKRASGKGGSKGKGR